MGKKEKKELKIHMMKEAYKDVLKILDDSDEADRQMQAELDKVRDDAPRAMIQQLVEQDTKVVRQDGGIMSSMFNMENVDVIVIKDKDGEYWYRGKDLCDLLMYANSRNTLGKHVSAKYKKSYADIGVLKAAGSVPKKDTLKIDPQTTFCTSCGLFQLVSRSKRPGAIKLWEKITREILPTLFTTGSYSLKPNTIDLERLTRNYYDETNFITKYNGIPVFYLAYVGMHNVSKVDGVPRYEYVLKFGITNSINIRDLFQHKKFYSIFNVIQVWECISNAEVEEQVKDNFRSKNMLVTLRLKGMGKSKEENRREHAIINEVNGLDYCINMISNVVNNITNPVETKYHRKINELEHKNELLETKYNHEHEMNSKLNKCNTELEDSRDHYKEIYQEQKESNKRLRGIIRNMRKQNPTVVIDGLSEMI
jgi:prophage antirepressor-like protein